MADQAKAKISLKALSFIVYLVIKTFMSEHHRFELFLGIYHEKISELLPSDFFFSSFNLSNFFDQIDGSSKIGFLSKVLSTIILF